ncbi:MAG: T9SS type A sorting domain-containing protein [Opitutaceae bacterium]|nr:T9SS type A sorting domain-containing protein [Cytophagales bacterium]
MKSTIRNTFSFIVITFLFSNSIIQAQQLAFPTAEGYGKYTTGGRGGKIYIVNNLNDAGSGSLREALLASGKRIVVFKISGIIKLLSDINISNGDLTILGQTAPGDGICIANYTVQLSASNIIIRYMRFRPGSYQTGEYDASWGRNNRDIILDHNSYSWGNDEQASFYDNTNFTMQYCLITESFYSSTHPKGDHGYGGIWGGMGATFHHNLLANHTSRMPRFCGARYHLATASTEIVDFRNNVIYNWGFNNSYGGEAGNHNMVNNYYKPGPATATGQVKYRIINPSDVKADGNPISKWFLSGNYMLGNAPVTADNWSAAVQPSDGTITLNELKLNAALPSMGIVTQTATDAYTKVLATAGASLKRDAVDLRAVNGVTSGSSNFGGIYGAKTGIIDNESQVGGFPVYTSTAPPTDTDNDGMPDSWETSHGLNNSLADQNSDRDSDGYTNIEEYAGCLVGEFSTCSTALPATIVKQGAGSSSQTVSIGTSIVPYSFAWNNASTVVVAGMPAGIVIDINNITKTASISGKPTITGVFNYVVATSGGNPDTTRKGTITVTDVLTDLQSEYLKTNLLVYPNPFKDKLNLCLTGVFSYEIFDTKGIRLLDGTADSILETGESLSKGVYLLRIQQDNQQRVIKIVKD